MLTVKVDVRISSGQGRAVAVATAHRALDAIHAFYLQRQGQIPKRTGRLRDSYTQMGAADNIARVVEGPRGPRAEYGSRVPYADMPNVRRKTPRPTAAAIIAAASQP